MVFGFLMFLCGESGDGGCVNVVWCLIYICSGYVFEFFLGVFGFIWLCLILLDQNSMFDFRFWP